ncbi:probable G-protein coupled receptor 139 [Heterodontus francisci]|uniref:probable G-protein coupled receptor 139 n=1 Tax=Heterodontus francisci TaxID=7792 RepID=UPI00355B5A90
MARGLASENELEGRSYEERLKDLRLFSLERRRRREYRCVLIYVAHPKIAEELSMDQRFTLRRSTVILMDKRQREHNSVNLLAIVILSRGKCGLSTCTTYYLVAMATADLLVIITDVILSRISYYYFRGSFLNITPVFRVILVLVGVATDCSVWFTVTFSFDRFVAISCQKLKTQYCTKKTVVVILTTACTLLCFKNVPFYFTLEPGWIIEDVPWSCNAKPSYFTEPGWVIFDWFDTVLTPLLPFTLILLLNALTVRHILMANRIRKGLRGQSKGENNRDPEMESRRKSMILLFAISGSFILLWLTRVIEFLYYSITGTNPIDSKGSLYIFRQVGFMLQILSCCTNTFIYGVTQSKFRKQFKSLVKYPVTSIIQLINKQNN